MEFSKDLVRGSIVPVVLSLLKDRAMYGYEIVKVVNQRTNGRLEWREGTLYPSLHRLEADRYVQARWAEAGGKKGKKEGGGRKRKYYAIARKGLRELERRRAEWKEFSSAVNAVLLVGG